MVADEDDDDDLDTPRDVSNAAYRSVRPSIPSINKRIAVALMEKRRTCDALEADLKMQHQTASASIRKMVLTELVEDSGERAKTRSGRKAIVWKLTTKGFQFAFGRQQ